MGPLEGDARLMSPILRAFLENERGLKRYLSRFFSRSQDVDDLTQETFLRAFADGGAGVHNPRAFLYRIARNLARKEAGLRDQEAAARRAAEAAAANEIAAQPFREQRRLRKAAMAAKGAYGKPPAG